MAKDSLPCFACGRELKQIDSDAPVNQPYAGTSFETHGHYGSTIYDPMDGHYLEINICDACLALHPERVIEGRDRQPVTEAGVIVGWEDVSWKPVPWVISVKERDYALEVTRRESGIDDLAPDAKMEELHG